MEGDRKSYKRRQMFTVVMTYIKSGLDQKAFCEQNNITHSKLGYWYSQYRKAARSKEPFISVELDDAPVIKQAEELKIILPNGIVVQLQSSEPENIIRSLLTQG